MLLCIYKIIINCDQWPINKHKKIDYLKQVNYNCNDDYLNLINKYLLDQIFKNESRTLAITWISIEISEMNKYRHFKYFQVSKQQKKNVIEQ